MRKRSVRRVLLGHGKVLDALPIDESLKAAGIDVVDVSTGRGEGKEWFAAELGLSGVDFLIAETGSVVLASRPDGPRSVSLLPPVHIAVAQRRQLLPDRSTRLPRWACAWRICPRACRLSRDRARPATLSCGLSPAFMDRAKSMWS